jgi:hypothetical protein
MIGVRWISDDDLEIATIPGYMLKVWQPKYSSDWDWMLFDAEGELIVHGTEWTEEQAKSACLRAYREHSDDGALNA